MILVCFDCLLANRFHTVWSFEFNHSGTTIAAAITQKKSYRSRIYDSKIAYTAVLEQKDHDVSQLYMKDVKDGQLKNLTVLDFGMV